MLKLLFLINGNDVTIFYLIIISSTGFCRKVYSTMELFVINRYTGEEKNNEGTPDEEELRKALIKKIKKRKKLNNLNSDEEIELKNKKTKVIDNFEDDTQYNSFIKETSESSAFNDELIQKENISECSNDSNLQRKDNSVKTVGQETSHKEFSASKENKKDKCQLDKQETGFTILEDVHISKKEKVKRKLPNWLLNPSVVSVDLKNLTCTVDSITDLDEIFVDKLREHNITHFFPVQSQIIPWLLKRAAKPRMYWPNDICVSAPTGSGKTLAFVLPILQALYKRIVPRIRALVVLPVQDLANQVFNVFQTYGEPTNLNILLLTKKRSFEEEQSLICKSDGLGSYRTMVDILVTTPGRLVDHLTKTKGLCLKDLTYLIIDEADRVMENIQNDWLYHLNKHINSECIRSYQIPVISYNNMVNKSRPPNKLLFSATLSQDPEKLQQLGLFQPKLFTSVVKSTSSNEGNKDETKFIGKYTTPAELTEYYINSTKATKPLILCYLLKNKSWKNVLCFVNSVEATSRLACVLKAITKKDVKIGQLSANLTVKRRNAVLKKFSNGDINVLISSDALARGIDIPNVQYVISYDAPKYIKTYIHRIGRTGRAGKEGTSIALLTTREKNDFQKMIETAGKSVQNLSINEEELEQYQSSYEKALKALGSLLEKEKQKQLLKLKNNKKLQKRIEKKMFVKKKDSIT